MIARMLMAIAATAAAALAQAPTVTTVLSNGTTASRYDMVILGDGYQAAEQARFNTDVNTFLTGLFAKTPYSTFPNYFNVHTVFRASVDSGANQPDVTPPIVKNTAYGASYNTGGTARCLYIQNTSLALADAALAPANESRILVMVNDSRYGGCASTFAVSYNGASMVEVQTHELGHSVAGLADEYDYPNVLYTGGEPNQVNVTTSNVGQKWSHWWGTDGVSAFQGGFYHTTGIWRPRADCLMRSLGQPNCAVCREQIVKTVNDRVQSILNPNPASQALTLARPSLQAFSFTNLVPVANSPLITWKIDGVVQPNQNSNGLFVNTAGMTLGAHTVTVEVQDRTVLVRNDPANILRESYTWSVTVTDPNAASLRITANGAVPQVLTVGAECDVTVTVANDGPAVANNVLVEQFLSVDTTLTTSDFYLGSATIPQIAVGATQTLTRRVKLPWSASPRVYQLFTQVNRLGVIVEPSMVDNVQARSVLVTAGGCAPKLEYRDDLLYPRDAASVSLQQGGTIRPTIVAPCAAIGTLYLLAWSCSGTQPGLALSPTMTLPLNFDSCTNTGLELINGSVFQLAFGALATNGLGNATIAFPSGLSLLPTPTHLAAVLLDPSLQFLGVTNAIAFGLQ